MNDTMSNKLSANKTEYIGVTEASEIVGICKDNIRKLIKQDQIKAVRIGKVYRIDKDKLYEWMDDHMGREVIL